MAASRLRSLLPARWPGRGAAAALATLAGCAAAVALAGPASAASHPGDRYNVGATHSPQLLAELAGPTGRPSPPASNAPAQPALRRGVDVAAYQHPNGAAINWGKVARSGISFAAVKATEGTYYRNPYALSDIKAARAAGLSVGAYVFAIPNGNGGRRGAVAQADYIVSYLGSLAASVPVMLDIEFNPYSGGFCYGRTPAADGELGGTVQRRGAGQDGPGAVHLHPARVVEPLHRRQRGAAQQPAVGAELHHCGQPRHAVRLDDVADLAVLQLLAPWPGFRTPGSPTWTGCSAASPRSDPDRRARVTPVRAAALLPAIPLLHRFG